MRNLFLGVQKIVRFYYRFNALGYKVGRIEEAPICTLEHGTELIIPSHYNNPKFMLEPQSVANSPRNS